jgi:hypothetical protein
MISFASLNAITTTETKLKENKHFHRIAPAII